MLVADENYYGDAPFFKTVIMKIVADATQRVQLLKNGDVDTATKIPFPEYEGLSTDENVKTLSIPSNLIVFVEMNNHARAVRQEGSPAGGCLCYSVSRTSSSRSTWDRPREAKSLIPSGMPTHDPSTNQYSYDLDKAKELLGHGRLSRRRRVCQTSR